MNPLKGPAPFTYQMLALSSTVAGLPSKVVVPKRSFQP